MDSKGKHVVAIGLLLAGIISRWVDRAMTRSSRFEPTVANFLSSLVKYALWALVLVTVLGQFGVQTTSILAALGGMALAVGLALQGTLSNVASGVMILVQKPFKVGEAINAGNAERDRPTVIDLIVTRDPGKMLPAVDSRVLKVEKGDRPV